MIAALGALLSSGATVATPAAAAPACQDVLFLGARGSGEPLTAADVKPGSRNVPGYGTTVDLARQQVLATAATMGLTVESQFVPYPAEDTSVLWSKALAIGGLANGITAYFGGLETGVGAVISILSQRAQSCPDEQIVLAGYSQGAMVMHRSVNRIEAITSGTLARVRAVILIADGDQLASTIAQRVGTAPTGSVGIAEAARATALVGPPITSDGSDIPLALHGRVQVICNFGDLVGAFTSSMFTSKGTFNKAVAVHTSYAKTTLPRDAGRWAGAQLIPSATVEGITSVQWVVAPTWTFDAAGAAYSVTSTARLTTTFSMTALQGHGYVSAQSVDPSTGHRSYAYLSLGQLSGTATDGVWRYATRFPLPAPGIWPGTYTVDRICLQVNGTEACRAAQPSEVVTYTIPPAA